MKRNNSRVRAMIILYNYDLTKELDIEGISEIINNNIEEEFPIDIDFSNDLIRGVINNLSNIDELINNHLENYTIDRLSYVDRNIIRLAVYEMLYLDHPIEIVINEYLNISREFTQIENYDTVKFNNAVLDKIANMKRLNDNAG
ncbi:MAG: transcription antitermination factor NusB [Acholeplasmataceae bacterium]|nr:transcription antitermination factor NusB [Acholeplasmataceae bacterium]